MTDDFLKYICSLAPEGETALIVKQIDTGKYYLDGKRKYTWPSYLPSHRRKEDEAWFINTGSFIIDRFKNGKPSASQANCDHVLFMMLDDIGETKVYDDGEVTIKTPPLEPTWIMETSEGSFQWGYVYSEQPTVGEHCATINALIRAEFTDRGAGNAVRNCRLPGSVNKKPGRNDFKARIVKFTRKEYTVKEICDAFGVVPDEASTAKYVSFQLKDTGNDSVLAWLNEQKLVLSRANKDGWLSVVCPNSHEHTDGNVEARYKPLDRSFCCYHGHCEDKIKSADFLKWVCDNGGPQVKHGLRDDLINERMQMLASKLPVNNVFKDSAEKRIEDVNRFQAGRVEQGQWFKRFYYVMDDDSYFDNESCIEYSRGTFNAIFRGVTCVSTKGLKPRRVEASIYYDEGRQQHCEYILKGVTYAAGESKLVHKDNLVYGNRWQNARPDVKGSGGDVTPWLEHCETLIPDERERNHVFDIMAFKVQHPNVKINHAVLHGGNEGRGKDTMWAPFIWAVCGPNKKNYGLIDNDGLSSQWGYSLESEILVLNELKEPDAAQRRALANKLKPIIAAPPDVITINRKGLHPYDMLNRIFVLAFSNDEIPISLPTQDRRWFCIWSSCDRMNPAAAHKLWEWYSKGGFEAIGSWLYARDVSAFNPTAAPMETEYKRTMIVGGLSTAEAYILHQIETHAVPFDTGVIGGPWYRHCEMLMSVGGAPSGLKIPQPALLHALKEAGWVDMGMCGSEDFPTKRHIYVRPDRRHESKSALRRAIEPIKAEGNVTPLRSSN